MMGIVYDGDIIRVTANMSWNAGADQVVNTYHTKANLFSGNYSDASVHTAIADALDTAYTALNTWISSAVTYDSIETWNLTQDRPMGVTAWPTLTTGDATGEMYAAQCAPLLLMYTLAPRSQGRKYLPPTTESFVSLGGTLNAAILAGIAAFGAALLDGWEITPLNAGAWGNWNKVLVRFAEWVAGVVETRLRTQRRRVEGVGT
jgi:hypothetical protein